VHASGYNASGARTFPVLYWLSGVRRAAITPRVFRPGSRRVLHIEGAGSGDIRLFLDEKIPAAATASAGAGVKLGSVLRVFSLHGR